MTTSADIRTLVNAKIADLGKERFLSKSREYGDDVFAYPTKIQTVDMDRKMNKIRAVLWDDRELQHEDIEELLYDLIGHIYITLARLEMDGVIDGVEGRQEPTALDGELELEPGGDWVTCQAEDCEIDHVCSTSIIHEKWVGS